MSELFQNQEENYQNFQNYENNPNNQTEQYPPNPSQSSPIPQDNNNDLPKEQLINSQNQSENNNQNYTPPKTEENEKIFDSVEPLIINSDATNDQPMIQLSEQPINEVEEDPQVQQLNPEYELEQPEQQPQERGCLAIRHIIMILVIIILLILIIVFATIKK